MSLGELVASPCPVCAHAVAAAFFDGGRQPLATLGWPASAEEARAMPRLPHDFVQCPSCSHVWNRSFRYEDVPDPECHRKGIVIRVEAVSIEGGDTLNRFRGALVATPHIVGYQAAGERG